MHPEYFNFTFTRSVASRCFRFLNIGSGESFTNVVERHKLKRCFIADDRYILSLGLGNKYMVEWICEGQASVLPDNARFAEITEFKPSRSMRPEKSAARSAALGSFPVEPDSDFQADAALTISVFLVSL